LPWTMGSTAHKIVHGARVPVLLVRAAARKKGRGVNFFDRILLPLDGSPLSERALRYVLEMARRLKSEVTVLSVVETGQKVHTIGGQDFVQFSDQYVEEIKEKLLAYLERIGQKLEKSGVNARTVFKTGNPAREIIKLSAELKIRLIVMTTRCKSGLREWVFGSVSNRVLHSGKTPLFLVK